QRQHTDRFIWSNASNSFAAENRVWLEFELTRFGDRPGQGKGGSARSIDLGTMMDLKHLGIEIAQYGSYFCRYLHQHRDANAHVGIDPRASAVAQLSCAGIRLRGKVCRARHDCGTRFRCDLQMAKRGASIGEVKGYGIGSGDRSVISRDSDAKVA